MTGIWTCASETQLCTRALFRTLKIVGIIAGFWCVSAFWADARAQSCTVTITDSAFGVVDVTANTVADTTATVTIRCTALISVALRICVSIGPGSGLGSDAAHRFMKSGANSLTYGLFSDAGRSNPWGSSFWSAGGAGPVAVDFPLFIGTSTKTATIYGRVYSGQQTVPAGSYLSSFSGQDAQINYGLLSLINCNLLASTAPTTFNATANVPTTCSVTTNDLNFGTVGALTAVKDSSTTLSPLCTNGTPYSIGLNGGLSLATDPTQRKMTKLTEFVLYGLYRNSARTLPFGNTIGVNTLAGTGSGLAQSVPVYGRIQPQTTPSPGVYNDTIVVTLTY